MNNNQSRLKDAAFAAAYLSTKETTLSVWRCTKRYDLPYVKIGASVRYDIEDLEKFIESRKVR